MADHVEKPGGRQGPCGHPDLALLSAGDPARWCQHCVGPLGHGLMLVGLDHAIPLILSRRNVPLQDQAVFNFSTYPYSLKVRWHRTLQRVMVISSDSLGPSCGLCVLADLREEKILAGSNTILDRWILQTDQHAITLFHTTTTTGQVSSWSSPLCEPTLS